MKFRVWNKNNKDWEKNSYFLDKNGDLFNYDRKFGLMFYDPEKIVVQFEVGKDDDNKQKLFDGDMVRIVYDGMLRREEIIGVIESFDCSYYILIQELGVSIYIMDNNIESIIKVGNEFENPELMMK